MKTTTLKAAAAFGLGALLMGSAAAQESVSKPVGYETLEINQQFNYVGLRLVGSPLATSTVATAENGTITLTSGTVADGPVIVEVVDGDAAGAVVPGSAAGGVVTVPADLLDNLEVDNTVTVREPQTLASIFGAEGESLDAAAGIGGADLVLVPDGSGGFVTYWYSSGGFGGVGSGWQMLNTETGNSDAIDGAVTTLIYTDGLIIQNRGGDNSIVVSGSVKTTATTPALTAQFNYLSTLYPAGATLSTAFDEAANPGVLRDGTLTASAGQGGADLVFVPNGPEFDVYWYSSGGFGGAGAGWKDSNGDDVDSTAVSLDSASGIVIQNRGDLPQGVAIEAPTFYADL
ncbi:MAG: hypothetical protein ABF379_08035 [Akkermansiaceae bacterium]